MVKFILKRIGTMIIAMFMIILITFTLMHSIPGGPFTNTKGVPEEVTQAMEAKYGLDQPMPVQFVKYLGNLLHGDFGPSYKYTGKTVNDFIATGAPVSAKLGLVTLVFVLAYLHPHGHISGAEKRQMAGYAADGHCHHRRYHSVFRDRLHADLCILL